jgi:hypothetical protein
MVSQRRRRDERRDHGCTCKCQSFVHQDSSFAAPRQQEERQAGGTGEKTKTATG